MRVVSTKWHLLHLETQFFYDLWVSNERYHATLEMTVTGKTYWWVLLACKVLIQETNYNENKHKKDTK